MNITRVLMALFVFCMVAGVLKQAQAQGKADMTPQTQIRIDFDGKSAVVALFANPQAQALLAQLPLTVTLEDFAGAEKIFYPPHKLNISGGSNADQLQGDFCYYAPWGNVAIFYEGMGHGSSLYVLGRLESGKEELAAMKKSFQATLRVVSE